MIDRGASFAHSGAVMFVRMYAIIAAYVISGIVTAAYIVGAAGYYEGWSAARTAAEVATIDDTVTESLTTHIIGPVLLAVWGPLLAMSEELMVGAARFGYATHSKLFARALALSILFVAGWYAYHCTSGVFAGGDETDVE